MDSKQCNFRKVNHCEMIIEKYQEKNRMKLNDFDMFFDHFVHKNQCRFRNFKSPSFNVRWWSFEILREEKKNVYLLCFVFKTI